MTHFTELPKKIADRVKGQIYINKKNKRFVKWSGKKLKYMCECGKALPIYNYEGETRAKYCASCKEDTMVNVISKKCACGKALPSYNYEGETTPICCASCKEDTMVNVISKKCACGKAIPIYNYEGETRAICCSSCKEEKMVNVKSKKCACGKAIPIYNYEGETTAIYCASCKEDTMVNIISKKCISEWCDIQPSNKQYEGYCLRCFIYHFPDKPVVRNYKTKEFAVVEYIKTYFPNVDWIADKNVNNGCSKKRPDLLLDLGYQVIIVEIDENQHTDYDCSCENKRIMELSQDVGHRPIVFIRFNPDDYETRDNTNITSCWGTDGLGICVVKKDKKKEWQERLNCLKNTIDYWIVPENKTNKTIETIELFYDE
jgi:hypothetical protein